MEKKRRFVSTTDEEIEQKRFKMNAQKPIKQNIVAATLLREYIKENISLFLGMEFSTDQYSVLILFSRFPYMALPSIVIFRNDFIQSLVVK